MMWRGKQPGNRVRPAILCNSQLQSPAIARKPRIEIEGACNISYADALTAALAEVFGEPAAMLLGGGKSARSESAREVLILAGLEAGG